MCGGHLFSFYLDPTGVQVANVNKLKLIYRLIGLQKVYDVTDRVGTSRPGSTRWRMNSPTWENGFATRFARSHFELGVRLKSIQKDRVQYGPDFASPTNVFT